MGNIWVISDTHFNHANILEFKTESGENVRSFDSLQEMNERIIDNWNSVVQTGDKVYHLGDVFFGPKEAHGPIWGRLKGKKRLVIGNHDNVKYLTQAGFFQKIMLWRTFRDFGLTLTHVPIHPSQFRNDTSLNVHGHTHERGSLEGPYKCVCVEKINYTPINIEDLRVK